MERAGWSFAFYAWLNKIKSVDPMCWNSEGMWSSRLSASGILGILSLDSHVASVFIPLTACVSQ